MRRRPAYPRLPRPAAVADPVTPPQQVAEQVQAQMLKSAGTARRMWSPPPECPHGTVYSQPCYGCGWMCPTCKRNYAPWVRECNYRHEDDEPVSTFGPVSPIAPVPADGQATMPAIYVPLRADAHVTPSRIADIQHMLTYVAPGEVEGKFVVLPPGARVVKTFKPEGPCIEVPAEMSSANYQHLSRVGRTWREIFPGLQCYVQNRPPEEDGTVTLCLRLTPQTGSDDPA